MPGDAIEDTRRSVYLKAMDRKVWAFALVGLAAVPVRGAHGGTRWRLAASGVASVPWRFTPLEQRLAETDTADERALDATIETALVEAKPLSGNAYKLPLLKRLVKRAIGANG